ncbi:MAG: hypothetical protein ACI906_004420 [Candidatus Latescibacterota bacterium]|jgi:hypothetical protein
MHTRTSSSLAQRCMWMCPLAPLAAIAFFYTLIKTWLICLAAQYTWGISAYSRSICKSVGRRFCNRAKALSNPSLISQSWNSASSSWAKLRRLFTSWPMRVLASPTTSILSANSCRACSWRGSSAPRRFRQRCDSPGRHWQPPLCLLLSAARAQ